jgi:hypothetical protein
VAHTRLAPQSFPGVGREREPYGGRDSTCNATSLTEEATAFAPRGRALSRLRTAKGTLHYKYYIRMGGVEEYTRSPAPMGARRSQKRGRVSWPAPALQRGAEGAKALGGLNF